MREEVRDRLQRFQDDHDAINDQISILNRHLPVSQSLLCHDLKYP